MFVRIRLQLTVKPYVHHSKNYTKMGIKITLKLTTLVTCFVLLYAEKARFDNYRVYSAKIRNERQLELLQGLEAKQDGIIFFEAPFAVHKSAELVVPPHKVRIPHCSRIN